MAIECINKGATRDFICEGQRKSTNPTIFVLKTLGNKEKFKIFGCLKGKDESSMGDAINEVIRIGVCEIKNIIIDGTPQDVKDITDDVVDVIPFEVLSEVSGAIGESLVVSEQERKN